jgi:hypothetical protein
VLTLKVAKEATADYNRVVTELSGYAGQLEARQKEAEAIVKPFDAEKIAALVTFYETVQKTVAAAQELITKMNSAIGQCGLAMAPLTAKRADQLDKLEMLEPIKAAIANAIADTRALTDNVSTLQASIASVAGLTDIVGKPTHAHMYGASKIWWTTSHAGAIAAFTADRNQPQSAPTPVAATTAAAATAAAPVATAQPVQAVAPQPTPAKATEPVAPKAASTAVAAQPAQPTFDAEKELSVLKAHMLETDRLLLETNNHLTKGKQNLIVRQQLVDCIGTETHYLQTHTPELACKPNAEWKTLWTQAASAVRSLEGFLATIDASKNSDLKHAQAKK